MIYQLVWINLSLPLINTTKQQKAKKEAAEIIKFLDEKKEEAQKLVGITGNIGATLNLSQLDKL